MCIRNKYGVGQCHFKGSEISYFGVMSRRWKWSCIRIPDCKRWFSYVHGILSKPVWQGDYSDTLIFEVKRRRIRVAVQAAAGNIIVKRQSRNESTAVQVRSESFSYDDPRERFMILLKHEPFYLPIRKYNCTADAAICRVLFWYWGELSTSVLGGREEFCIVAVPVTVWSTNYLGDIQISEPVRRTGKMY